MWRGTGPGRLWCGDGWGGLVGIRFLGPEVRGRVEAFEGWLVGIYFGSIA